MCDRTSIVNEVKKYLGVPYVWGGENPKGFDSPGLVVFVFKKACGIKFSHFTEDMLKKGSEVSRGNLRAGDLIFTSEHHVGICISNNQFIHAPQTGDVVKISNINNFYAGRRFI